MKYIYICVRDIDYNVLLKKFKPAEKRETSKVLLSIIEILINILKNFSVIFNFAIKKIVDMSAKDFGLQLKIYIEKDKSKLIKHIKENRNHMLNITISINNIDYNKIMRAVKSSPDKSDKKENENNFDVAGIIKIVEPFIADTMKTIPPKAIAELFMLLGREQIMKLAQNFGVELSDISVTAPN